MLTITIINDRTGTVANANYTYLVRSNYRVIASGRITGHNRTNGWKALALEVVAPEMFGALIAINDLCAPLSRLTAGDDEKWERAMRLVRDALAKVGGDE